MSRPHVVTPAELQSLRDLELMTQATVEGLRQGLHRSPFHGYSAEFSQYRHYRPGDDLKYVDWKAFARTDRIYSRQFRETTNLSALFVIDVSRSMDFPAGNRRRDREPRKFALARRWRRSSARWCSIKATPPACSRSTNARTSCRREAGIITCASSWRSSRRLRPRGSSSIAEALRRAADDPEAARPGRSSSRISTTTRPRSGRCGGWRAWATTSSSSTRCRARS